MKTVKEISQLTGVSVRTLHYYDEIGLLPPTQKSAAGYRLYDDRALDTLRQILFFREFGLPLCQIRDILEDPSFERKQILLVQRKMLESKKARLTRLIAGIDDILKGEDSMDFTFFSRDETEGLFQTMFEHMPADIRGIAIEEFGSAEAWRQHYISAVSSAQMQKRYAEVAAWYGGKEAFLAAANHPISKEAAESCGKAMDTILQKLLDKRGLPLHSLEVKELVGAYALAMKQLAQLQDEHGMMLSQARVYREEPVKTATDQKYGAGAAEFFARAIEAFYTAR